MSSFPAYSVVIPAFNAAATIGEAIRSTLEQGAVPAEIVVVDDGSADATGEIAAAASPLVRTIRQENKGPGAATTTGMAAARHEIIATLDADDLWLPNKMEAQLAHLAERPACDAVFARLVSFAPERADGPPRDGWLRSTMVIRRRVYEAIGDMKDFPGSLGDLVDWLARAREEGFSLEMMPDVLVRRRIRAGSLSYGLTRERDPARERGYVHAARRAMLRRRSAGET